jgi:hypothetical protein
LFMLAPQRNEQFILYATIGGLSNIVALTISLEHVAPPQHNRGGVISQSQSGKYLHLPARIDVATRRRALIKSSAVGIRVRKAMAYWRQPCRHPVTGFQLHAAREISPTAVWSAMASSSVILHRFALRCDNPATNSDAGSAKGI